MFELRIPWLVLLLVLVVASPSHAQTQPPPAFPPPATQAPAEPPPPQQQPYPPAQQQPAQQPPPTQQPYPPQQDPAAPPPYAQPQQPPQQQPSYAAQPPPSPPPPPPSDSGSNFEMPGISARIDPLNWLIYGQLYLELEVEAFEWLTIETIPMFVVSEQPVIFNAADELEQESGMGPIAGASIGLGFWLDADAFRGTVLRTGLTFYNIDYRTIAQQDFAGSATFDPVDRGEVIDAVTHEQRRLSFIIGSHRRWGFFTLVGGFGLEYELNDDKRCILEGDDGVFGAARTDLCDDDELLLATEPLGRPSGPSAYNVFDGLHPIYLTFRLSLGVVID